MIQLQNGIFRLFVVGDIKVRISRQDKNQLVTLISIQELTRTGNLCEKSRLHKNPRSCKTRSSSGFTLEMITSSLANSTFLKCVF